MYRARAWENKSAMESTGKGQEGEETKKRKKKKIPRPGNIDEALLLCHSASARFHREKLRCGERCVGGGVDAPAAAGNRDLLA